MKTKFAIGCLIQWYEIDMISEYVDSLKDAVISYDGEIYIDINFVMNQDLEKSTMTQSEMDDAKLKVYNMFLDLQKLRDGILVFTNYSKNIYTIADYRRDFNNKFCDSVDVLVWGESDMIVPKQMFISLDLLHQEQSSITPKYIATFAICKMWDDSWKQIEHPDFTNKPFIEGDTKNWWNIPYTMTKDEMNSFNDKVINLELKLIKPHKFNGCGLAISSEIIKTGVNIPKSSFFIHEDTSFMIMLHKILGDIPQYHFGNILLVHNRKHKNKRKYVNGESDSDYIDIKRKRFDWYNIANKMCEQNNANLFNANYKSFTWHDVWNSIK
jgi:hypothetical protein